MIPIPVAAFLAGAILTLVLPAALFVALTAWYLRFVRGVPENPARDEPETTGHPPAGPDGAPS